MPAKTSTVTKKTKAIAKSSSVTKSSKAIAKKLSVPKKSKAIAQSILVEKVKPKKVLSPYLCFTTANVKTIAEKENLPFTQAIKKAAEMWNALNEKAKEPYLKLQAKDQLRYDNEMSQFNKTGYFTNKEGVCSSTLKAKAKKQKVLEAI